MNHRDINDWRTVAHDEYETRKNAELKLSHASNVLNTLKQTLVTSNNYNSILEYKLADVEAKCAAQANKLHKCIEMLKNAKLLFKKRKHQIINLELENKTLQAEIAKLKDQLTTKSAQLEAEVLQHEKTSQQLAQALTKITSITAAAMANVSWLPAPPERPVTTSPDVIYAEGHEHATAMKVKMRVLHKKTESLTLALLEKIFAW